MVPSWPRLWAILCLVLCLNAAAAGRLGLTRRQDASPTTTIASTTADKTTRATMTTASPLNSDDAKVSSGVLTSSNVGPAATGTFSATPIPSAINGSPIENTTSIFNTTTIPEGELPLEPRLTPGWAVSGVILLITGAIYAVIGIKNTWLHTFFSTTYLSAVCTTILIVYVMVPPISDGVQGAYVVAVVCTGLILGAGATVFKEITECIGCLLGGFCLSMWLLTLREGGLLTNTGAKIGFIAAFTLGGFALYFSHYTRVYALIGSISFAGATVAVLGIDCFSRAGLKEFWAYIWALNENLFPLGADTYPLTKGIRVEIALTIIICLCGIVSQLKMWKLIQEHRAKRAEAQIEAQRELDVEEAHVGQQIEQQAAQERRQWEAAYGDKPPGSPSGSGDSGVADLNEKKPRYSQTTVKRVSAGQDVIELAELPAPSASPSRSTAGEFETHGRESQVLEAVAEPKVWVVGSDGEARPASWVSARNSQRLSRSSGPEVIPLPFQIPERSARDDDDRSSFATFADDDRSIILSHRASRASLGNRLSVGSTNLLRSLSKSSQRSTRSKVMTGETSPSRLSHAWSESQEDLVSDAPNADRDAGSTSATVDGMSSDDDDDDEDTVRDGHAGHVMEITATLAERAPNGESNTVEMPVAPSRYQVTPQEPEVRPLSVAETVATDILNMSTFGGSAQVKFDEGSSNNPAPDERDQATSNTTSSDKSDSPKPPGVSVHPSSVSTLASLTKGRLPSGLSRVASAYRTNEWAKHLSRAEAPEPETPAMSEDTVQEEVIEDDEPAAPVNVESLQQTAQNATPAPALTRMPSTISNPSPAHGLSRSNSRMSMASSMAPTLDKDDLTISTGPALDLDTRANTVSMSHPNPLHTKHSFQKSRMQSRRTSADVIAQPIAEEHATEHESPPLEVGHASGQPSSIAVEFQQPYTRPPVPGVVSYSSPQTLLGKREMLLRNKSSVSINPAIRDSSPQPPGSDAGSVYNYPTYTPYLVQDADNIPLSQRKQLMRRGSLLSVGTPEIPGMLRPDSNLAMAYVPGQTEHLWGAMPADDVPFDAHRPRERGSTLPSQTARNAQLASFRQSVAQDLLARTPVAPASGVGGETPLILASLPQGVGGSLGMSSSIRSSDVSRNMEASRNMLLSQREQEAQRREMQRWEKERNDRAFEEHMRSGLLMDAHRDAMRRMQSAARDG